jgi:hypothetical protein
MNNATILPNVFTVNQFKAILDFENCILDKSIYNKDQTFNTFINDTVLNILTQENIKEIISNIESENIFFESFYFAFLLYGKLIPNNVNYKFALNYLKENNYNNHFYVLDYYLEVY